jgi:hypothetical protein
LVLGDRLAAAHGLDDPLAEVAPHPVVDAAQLREFLDGVRAQPDQSDHHVVGQHVLERDVALARVAIA